MFLGWLSLHFLGSFTGLNGGDKNLIQTLGPNENLPANNCRRRDKDSPHLAISEIPPIWADQTCCYKESQCRDASGKVNLTLFNAEPSSGEN
jgi:hypothetical protein